MAAKKENTQLTKQQTGGGVYKKVTETLIGLIEDGRPPWRTRWSSVRNKRQRTRTPLLVPDRRLLLPISLSSGKPYQGITERCATKETFLTQGPPRQRMMGSIAVFASGGRLPGGVPSGVPLGPG